MTVTSRGAAALRRLRDGLRRRASARVVAAVTVLSLVAGILAFGEPSRPATATVVRPIVTVQALCTQPTIIDVAAREATRGLSAIDTLLELDDPVVLEEARDVAITETDAGTFFVRIADGELRLAVLRPTGLPLLAAGGDAEQRRTHRTFELPGEIARQPATFVPADDAVFVLFGGAGAPVSAIRLDATTLTGETAALSAGRAPDGLEVSGPATGFGRAVAHGQLLWVAGDDGSVWTYDAAVDAADRWTPLDGDLQGGVLAAAEDAVHGVFARDGGGAELRSWATAETGPATLALPESSDVRIEAATGSASSRPGFVVRDQGGRLGLLAPRGDRVELTWSEDLALDAVDGSLVGVIFHDEAAALVSAGGLGVAYHVVDGQGRHAGSFTRQPDEPDCVTGHDWRDAAHLVAPLAGGSLLHLHLPDSQFDCVLDTREGLADLEDRCAPDGSWSIDKGAAPASDFTIEIERAVEEFRDDTEDASDDPEEAEEDRPEAPDDEPERREDEFADAGLGIQEVDEDLTEACAAEEVTAVVAPDLERLEAVGDRAVRVDWSWAGGRCLPERYVLHVCLVAPDGDGCTESRDEEIVDRDGASNRLSTEIATRPGRTYRVSVTASKQGITSSPSRMLSIATPTAVPAAPGSVRARLDGGVWSLSWTSCLDDRTCDQRPDGFEVTVEGCEGDSLPRQSQRLGAGERRARYDVSGNGFQGTDLLGRRVRFTVAATVGGFTSDRVPAGPCTESVRPGRTVSHGDAPVRVALSGRTTSMTLEAPGRSAGLTQLFGRSSFDDVSARLVRDGAATSERSGALGASVTFTVPRCELAGWTVELTPRRGGQSLTDHRARITGVPAACGWTVTEDTSTSAEAVGGNAGSITVRVTIPGLREDVRTDKVAGVSATSSCRRWNGGTAEPAVSRGSISGDVVTFSVATPPVLDLAGACTIAPRVEGKDGSAVVPRGTGLDLRPVGQAVANRVGPAVVETLKASTTATYVEGAGGGRLFRNNRVRVTIDGSGLRCLESAGSSVWEITTSGGRPLSDACVGQRRVMEFGRNDLDDHGHADIRYRLRLTPRGPAYEVTQRTNICALPGGERQPPCVEIEACEWNGDIPADDPACVEPCPWDPDLPIDDAGCVEPVPDPDPDPGDPDPGDPDPGDPDDPGDGGGGGDDPGTEP
jgi:hypothetical protein